MCEQHACVVASLHRKRAQVVLPADLIRDIDALVGENGRSEFVAEVAQREVQRRRFMQLLDHPGPGWNLEDHPELKDGAAAWISKLRQEDEQVDRED